MNEVRPGDIIFTDPETGQLVFRRPTKIEKLQYAVSSACYFVVYRIVLPFLGLFFGSKRQ